MKSFDLIVVGNGIAAKCFLLELASSNINNNIKVLQLYSDQKNIPCSLRTTGIVSLHGTKRGISPLGDLIFDSYEMAKEFFDTRKPDGISEAYHYNLCGDSGPSKILHRYGRALVKEALDEIGFSFIGKEFFQRENAYLVDCDKFLSWMDFEIEKKLEKNAKISLAKQEDSVLNILNKDQKNYLITENGKEYLGESLLLCTGAYTKISDNIFPQVGPIVRSKVVGGGYLKFKNIDWGKKDFVLSRNSKNFIFRSLDKTLLIGPMACDGEIQLSEYRILKEEYQSLKKLFHHGQTNWPNFKSGEILQGIRHKGIKRRPFWGRVSDLDMPPMFGFFSLYKNGFTYPFKGAKELVPKVLSSLNQANNS